MDEDDDNNAANDVDDDDEQKWAGGTRIVDGHKRNYNLICFNKTFKTQFNILVITDRTEKKDKALSKNENILECSQKKKIKIKNEKK